jgi:hypothetical protein
LESPIAAEIAVETLRVVRPVRQFMSKVGIVGLGVAESSAGFHCPQAVENMAERVGFEPRLFHEINKSGGANGASNLHNSTKTTNSTFYWTLKRTLISPWSSMSPEL